MASLYNRIESLCVEAGITVTDLCKQSGASRGSLTDLKMGRKKSLSADTLEKISEYFHVSIDYLLTGAGEAAVGTSSALDIPYFRFGKRAQDMGMTQADMDFILSFYEDHKRRNSGKE